jgi:hypothetical protein
MLFLSFGLFILVGHKFAAPAISPGFAKDDLTLKAESPLPNSPRSVKKVLDGSHDAK